MRSLTMRTRRMMPIGILATALLGIASTSTAEPAVPGLDGATTIDRIQALTEAQIAYDKGLHLENVDPKLAHAAFTESADGWQRVIASGISNGRLWTNLGNAELRAGRLGDAVAAYLEADRLMPGDATVRANLAEARNQIPARFDSEGVVVLYDTVSDGWHVLGFDVRWWIAGVAWVGFWAMLGVSIVRGRREDVESEGRSIAWRGALMILAAVAIISGATIAFDATEDAWRSPGVLVEDSVVRTGNGETFASIFSEALPAGVEFDLLESRPGWHHVAFADGREGWIRSDHVKVIGS